MTTKTTVCATAVALLAGTACLTMQAEARDLTTPPSQFKVSTSRGNKNLYMSAAAVYDAGVRHGSTRASHDAYLRGFRDGTSTTAYTSRQYVVNAPVYSGASVYSPAPVYSAAPAYGYSPYSRNTAYAPGVAGYSDNGGTVALDDSYGNGDGTTPYNGGGYSAGYAPRPLMDMAVTPVVMAQPLEAQNARLSYCAARYQSFDPASGTFLGDDGYRHYCR